MLKVYLAIIRPILEYALPVLQAIPEYLSYKIESVWKRALKIINPGLEENYDELLKLFNVEKLQIRRGKLCKQYMDLFFTLLGFLCSYRGIYSIFPSNQFPFNN
jgi:hypothetical protein